MDEKSCKKCRHYMQYYIIANARLRRIDKGHCGNIYANGKQRNTDRPCEEWQESVAVYREKSFRIILERIAKNVEDLSLIIDRENL